MRILISPAKKLDFESNLSGQLAPTAPVLMKNASELARIMKDYSADDLRSLMSISQPLAELNQQRFSSWSTGKKNAKPAVLVFRGDVYVGLRADEFSDEDLQYAQQHLRILSGLYGLLRPLDQIHPYRLEMGSKVKTSKGGTLYKYWGDTLARELNKEAGQSDDALWVNLASQEYAKAVPFDVLCGRVVAPQFRDLKNGVYKSIGFFAKRARGAMARYILRNRLQDEKGLQNFSDLGYRYSAEDSTAAKPVFLRD